MQTFKKNLRAILIMICLFSSVLPIYGQSSGIMLPLVDPIGQCPTCGYFFSGYAVYNGKWVYHIKGVAIPSKAPRTRNNLLCHPDRSPA